MDNTKTGRTDTEILKELIDVLMEYDADRDAEWNFQEEHPDMAFWSAENENEHEQILTDIQKNRNRIQAIIREATGDETINF